MSGSDKETLRITMLGYGSKKMSEYKTTSMGPEMKILRDQIHTVQNTVIYKWDKYDDKTRDSFVKQLKAANNIK